ncbi:MAG: RNA methyltransferase [Ruminococcaceae bacterium]|nr:RNA methyltransferase [Oscillospiraceae bacterium]
MQQEITRADHPLIKQTASLKEKKYRERFGEFLVEGELSVLWALQSSYVINTVFYADDYTLPQQISENLVDIPTYRVPTHLLAKMADTKTPQGIVCTCAFRETPPLPQKGRFIYCDQVRDPGNLGSILRSADALGYDGVMLSPLCVDPFNPKLVRSTMGSLFHISLYTDIDLESLKTMQKGGFQLAVSSLTETSISLGDFAPEENLIIVVGNESKGVSKPVTEAADVVVKIPMAGSAESLNVAAAAAILMYEANAGRLS